MATLLAAPSADVGGANLSNRLPGGFCCRLARSVARSQFLGQREAQLFDEQLMSSRFGFSIDQLMELAGLSVACAVGKAFPSQQLGSAASESYRRVLVVAGPGNNGCGCCHCIVDL